MRIWSVVRENLLCVILLGDEFFCFSAVFLMMGGSYFCQKIIGLI